MSPRYRLVAVAFGLIFASVAFWFSWDKFSTYKQNQSNERAAAAQYQADTAQHSPTSCRSIVQESGLIDWLTCLADNISADGSVKQSEYDLKAQQDMAAWAFGMLIATVWLTVITLFGVFFVWRTLKATQGMAAETTRIGEAQTRAYLRAEIGDVTQKPIQREDGANFTFTINLKIKNTGITPALSYVVFFYLNDTEVGDRGTLTLERDGRSSGKTHSYLASGETRNVTVSRTWTVKNRDALMKRDGRFVRFSYAIRYVDVFERTLDTPVTSGIFAENPSGQTAFLPDFSISPDEIEQR